MPYVRSEFGHTHTGQCWEPMLSWLGRLSLNGPCQVRPAGFVTPPFTASGVGEPVQVGVGWGTQGVLLMGWSGFGCLHLDRCASELLDHDVVQDDALCPCDEGDTITRWRA